MFEGGVVLYVLLTSILVLNRKGAFSPFLYPIAEPWFCPFISRAPHFAYFLLTSGKPWKITQTENAQYFPVIL